MARSFTVGALLTAVRRMADMEGSTFVSDTEIRTYLNRVYPELWDLLVKSGISYNESTQSITSTAGTATYALPADYYGTVGVDVLYDGTNYVSLMKVEPRERNRWPAGSARYSCGYRVVGSNLTLYPAPSASGQTYRHLYIPVAGTLDDDNDAVDGVSGWEELLVIDAAILCLQKEETNTAVLERKRARIIERIEEAAVNREWGEPGRVVDVNRDLDPDLRWWNR